MSGPSERRANSISQVLAAGAALLSSAGVVDARREAGSLLAYALGRDRAYVITHRNDLLQDNQLDRFRTLLARRAAREPLQYITGHQEFFKLDFEVTPEVLIPRPETELVVEAALEYAQHNGPLSILDVGTGSGCIVISLLTELRSARATGSDISANALQVAQRNAGRHGVSDRLPLIQADSLRTFAERSFSLIVANPPYVPADDIETLPPEVREHEPLTALISGADGLDHIRALLRETPRVLQTNGYFVFEIGFGQSKAVEEMIDPARWRLIEMKRDLQNIPRTILLQKR